jgi:hypothetical protein
MRNPRKRNRDKKIKKMSKMIFIDSLLMRGILEKLKIKGGSPGGP